VTLAKECAPTVGSFTPAESVPPGTLLRCVVTVKLGPGTYSGLTVTDVVSGGGHASDTVVTGGPTLVSDQLNRQVYTLGTLSVVCSSPSCTTGFTFFLRTPSTLDCYRNMTNGVYIDQAGVTGHVAVASDSFSVNCHARPVI